MSLYRATLTILATELSKAAQLDEKEGFDLGAGLFGENLSEWLRKTAETISGEKRPASALLIEPLPDPMFCGCKGLPTTFGCKDFNGDDGKCLRAEDLCEHQVPF